MKKIVLWLAFIVGIIAVIGACSKSEDSSTAATTSSCAGVTGWTEATSCSGTASGSITGIDNLTFSGSYSKNNLWAWFNYGVDNSTGCVDNTTMVSGFSIGSASAPTGSNSMIWEWVVTSSSSIAQNYKFYSDTSCQTEIATLTLGYNDFTVGDNVSGLSATAGSTSGLQPTATKVSYTQSCLGMKASTDAGATFLTAAFGSAGVSPTVGTTHTCSIGGDTTNAFMKLDNESTQPAAYETVYGTDMTFFHWDDDATTDWTSGVETLFTLP
jgi:hypothetical protein